jgi:uncharacterized membrane protein YdjX (TVP38/TMEM64 family)
VLVVLAYVVGGLLAFPHGLMIWATAFIFPPLTAIAYAEVGTAFSGVAMYFVGRSMSKAVIERMSGSRLGPLREGFARNAVVSLILLHVFPIMPFTVLNLAAGSSGVRLRWYLTGTMIGVTPGIVVVCFFGHQLLRILHHPNVWDIAVLVAFVIVGFFMLRWLRSMFGSKLKTLNSQENGIPPA